jgi:hypothetical protein
MKNISLRFILTTAIVLAMFACTEDFEEMNTNPNQLTNVPYTALMTNAELGVIGTYAGFGGFGEERWVRYNARDVYVHGDRYQILGDGTNFNYYSGHLQDLRKAMDNAMLAGDDNATAVLKILTAYSYQNITDWFGDIPYTEALMGDDSDNPNIFPKYDTQESIYTDLIAQLKAANTMINPAANIGSADVIFNGNMMMWKRFCNSLLLRVYMRISEVKPSVSQAGIEEIMGDPSTYPIITSVEEAAFKYWLPDDPNYRSPYWINPANNPKSVSEIVVADFLVRTLKDRNDPRLPVYAEPALNSGEIVGNVLGTLGLNTPDLSIRGMAEFGSKDSPTRIMRYAEVMFIIAEAANKGWNVGISAKDAYEAAIEASFDEYGLEGIEDYLSEPLVAWDGGTPHAELIGDQKWIALYLDGIQAWADVRRTGYPTYVDVTEPVGAFYPGMGTIKRIPYPYSEQINNPESLAAALANQPGIVDEKFGKGVWWDVN